jgi:hypothetical protein
MIEFKKKDRAVSMLANLPAHAHGLDQVFRL